MPQSHGNCKLDLDQELALVETILAFSYAKNPLHPSDVIALAKEVYGKPDDPPTALDWGWYRSFRLRHSDYFKNQSVEGISAARIGTSQLKEVPEFVKSLKNVLAENQYPANSIVNWDEILICAQGAKLCSRALTPVERKTRVIHSFRGQNIGSMLVSVTAEGHRDFAVVILKVTKEDEDRMNALYKGKVFHSIGPFKKEDGPMYFAFSSTGMMNSNLWKNCVEKYCELRNQIHPGLNALIFMDNLSCHHFLSAMLVAQKNGVRFFFLPPHCSAWLQPLDKICFALFKQIFLRHVAKNMSNIATNAQWRSVLLYALRRGVTEAFTENVIKASFEQVGLYPFDDHTIIKNMNLNVHTVSSADKIKQHAKSLCEAMMKKQSASTEMVEHDLQPVVASVEVNKLYDSYELIKIEKENERKRK